MKLIRQLYDWMGTHVHKPYATPFLAAAFFVEAIFFLPTDPLLILYCVERRKQALWYAAVATVASVLGGITAYYIGYALWESIGSTLVHWCLSPEQFASLTLRYAEKEAWAVLIAGFSPLPYKAVTLTAGFCRLPLAPFIICSIIARGARFFLVGTVVYVWGPRIKEYIDRYFNLLVLLFVIIVIVSIWIFK